MKSIHFDIVCGASGDMILSSLIDLGVPVDWLSSQLDRLGIEGLRVEAGTLKRSGISCSHIDIEAPEQREHRHPSRIQEIIQKGNYGGSVQDNALGVLMRLARAEAAVHEIPVEKVHFHEIGAVDTIVDILGTCLCLEYLKVERLTFAELLHGKGTLRMAHGLMPLPAPATAHMLQGFRTRELDIEGEILTPTGCAILTELGEQVPSVPSSRLLKVGYGSGDKEFEGYSNVLRAQLREETAQQGTPEAVCVLETDMDHISGEVLAYAAERAVDSGALDVTWAPVYMKKGRPGYRMTVLCRPERREELVSAIMKETRTLGVRYHDSSRIVAHRTKSYRRLLGADIREKNCSYGDMHFTKAEFDSLSLIARESNRPYLEVLEEYMRRNAESRD